MPAFPLAYSALYLERGQTHLVTLKVSLFLAQDLSHLKGLLHCNSRSIVFEPRDSDQHHLRLKLSDRLFLRFVKGLDCDKLKNLLRLRLPFSQFQELFAKPEALLALLQREDRRILGRQRQAVNQWYNSAADKKGADELDRGVKCLVVRSEWVSRFRTSQTRGLECKRLDEPLVFVLSKMNSKDQIIQLLQAYKLLQSLDEGSCVSEKVSQSIERRRRELTARSGLISCHRASRLCLKTLEQGLLLLSYEKLEFHSVANQVSRNPLGYWLAQVKHVKVYSHACQPGLQLFFYSQHHSLVLLLEQRESRDKLVSDLQRVCPKLVPLASAQKAAQEWAAGLLSSYEYLLHLNVLANRSFNDLSQYPIFPWVVKEYSGNEFQPTNPQFYRDLRVPVGALNKHRLKRLKDLEAIQKQRKQAKGFLYQTFSSNPSIVQYYLQRKLPQLQIPKELDLFSQSDKVFQSLEQAYYVAVNEGSDFKELIPQFYEGDSGFLVNSHGVDLGCSAGEEKIDDVVLPAWAADGQELIRKLRHCLEGDIAGASLHHWVDLTFGYQQRGQEALKADNLFSPHIFLTALDADPLKSKVDLLLLKEFGASPSQLFTKASPGKRLRPSRALDRPASQDEEDTLQMVAPQIKEGDFDFLSESEIRKVRAMN